MAFVGEMAFSNMIISYVLTELKIVSKSNLLVISIFFAAQLPKAIHCLCVLTAPTDERE